MKQLLMFLVMLSIPSVLHAAPLFKTIVYHNDSGTVPPEYHFSSTLTIVPDHANKTLSLEYEVEHSYGEGPGESYKNQIGKDWYDDDVSLLNGLKVCEGRPDAKERGIGGSTPLIHIVGDNLGALLKAGKAGEGALSITPDDICRNTKGWWDEWEKLAGRISSAVKASAKKEKAPVYRYLHVGKGEILLDIEIRSDLATRTAKVFLFGKHKKDLDKKQLEKLEGLIAAPNYYQDGIVKDPEHENYGDFIDRGGGVFFSFEKGLADPVGRSGTREALKAFFKALAD